MDLIKEYTRIKKIEEGYPHAKTLIAPMGEIDEVVEWCKQELRGSWKWQIITSSSPSVPGAYSFFFIEDCDYFAFVLKYGG